MKILVTGGTSRLGEALIRRLVSRGHDVYFTYNSSTNEARLLASELDIRGYQLDLASLDQHSASEFLHCAINDEIDAIINNSSLFEYDEPGNLNFELMDRAYRINLKAPLLLTEALIKTRTPEKNRLAVNILDAKLNALNPDYASYTFTKYALKSFTEMYGMLQETLGIKVLGVAPAMFAESGSITSGRVEELTQMNPLNLRLSVEDVVNTVEFCLTGIPKSGEIIFVDAGQTLLKFERDVAYLKK